LIQKMPVRYRMMFGVGKPTRATRTENEPR
jgi:hypothetical protein